jgi:hypothetical protein
LTADITDKKNNYDFASKKPDYSKYLYLIEETIDFKNECDDLLATIGFQKEEI